MVISYVITRDKPDMSDLKKKPLFLRPRDWPKDLVDPKKRSWEGMKNPLAWIIALLLFPILLYLREYFGYS